MNRREFIRAGLAGVLLTTCTSAYGALQTNTKQQDKKIVWIVLRGAMDSLHTIIPTFDPELMQYRKNILDPIKGSLLPIDRGFHFHPKLKGFHSLYTQKQLLPIVATASPYRKRSHFDAQDILEAGGEDFDLSSGWLGRAISQIDGDSVAISRSIPISLKGEKLATTWYPSKLQPADEDIYERLERLYIHDEQLSKMLKSGIKTRSMMSDSALKRKPKFRDLTKSCGELLRTNTNAKCAMLEFGGWDTHNNQQYRLSKQLEELDTGITQLKQSLGSQWQNTVVIVATEFGRTVTLNGTKGTDHGTASAMFLAGGACRGGKILGEWPGLSENSLYESRDLMPTSDIRSWLATILDQHWALSDSQIEKVFPSVMKKAEKLVL